MPRAGCEKFFKQTFWANIEVFRCCQAAQALAKRGENIDRCFIGESPGEVGQSLYSAHLDAVYGHNHSFFDPNVWYKDDELRKQIEQFADCIIITGQEAPEQTKRMREDLFKRTMSADGIAGRKPYGIATRMMKCVGWKRMEVNKIMKFMGVSEENFLSILRRALVWWPKARFIDGEYLEKHVPEHELDGVFPKDPSLKVFLESGPAVAAGLRIQHAFETKHRKKDCEAIIEGYAYLGGDLGITEAKMRQACGLRPRVRHAHLNQGPLSTLPAESQEMEDEQAIPDRCEQVQGDFMAHCLKNFKESLTLRDVQVPGMSSEGNNQRGALERSFITRSSS